MADSKPKKPRRRWVIVHVKMEEDVAKLLEILAERHRRTKTAELEQAVIDAAAREGVEVDSDGTTA